MRDHVLLDVETVVIVNMVAAGAWILLALHVDHGLVVLLGANLAALAACVARRSAAGKHALEVDALIIGGANLIGVAAWQLMDTNWEPGIVLAVGLNLAAFVMCKALHQRRALAASRGDGGRDP